MKTIAFLMMLIPGIAFAGDWDRTEKRLYQSYLLLEAADCLQTRYSLSRPDEFSERNPVLREVGSENVIPYCVIEALGVYYLADRLPHKWRKGFLAVATSINIWCVRHNYKAGIKFRF
jgi:hypothetical protein